MAGFTRDPLVALKEHFGFDAFRPLQAEIVGDALAGRDVLVLLPTGGGKSLCYQLPALLTDGLTVVVSPLIALMKDQVDALRTAGIAATFLNSSLTPVESGARLRGLHQGEFKLLYVAPERLLLSGFLEQLAGWKLARFAIDEAHCISEWGHDFRPEYRQLAGLRKRFPDVPVMALTATATGRVRDDIANQLALRDPRLYVASFNRPNLAYRVSGKAGAYAQLLGFLRERPDESGIIYCQARKTTESIAEKLRQDGVAAAPYHAGMEGGDRAKNQEAFLRDEVRVVCATIAFGMGINKSNVRFVIHYDLPKNLEGYYQETGRAGRDGLPADCLLLYSPGDRVKQMRFIEEKTDPREREVALAQLEDVLHYAESGDCRRARLLAHFGEEYPETNCGGCDNCLSPREQFDGTVAAQKFLSCVYRIHEKSGFGLGLNHVIEVLTGADTEKVRKFGHDRLSTYGVGTGHTRQEWAAIGRELIRLGHVRQNAAAFNALELTAEGRQLLKSRTAVRLTKAVTAAAPSVTRAGAIECDEALFGSLRALRKRLADEQGVPPYVIFSDVSLREMARRYPASPAAFAIVSGVGATKLRQFAEPFLAVIGQHVRDHGKREFAPAAAVAPPAAMRSRLTESVRETLALFRRGRTITEIARARQFAESTIYGHLATAIEVGEELDVSAYIEVAAVPEIEAALHKHGRVSLGRVKEELRDRFDYGLLQLVRARMLAQGKL